MDIQQEVNIKLLEAFAQKGIRFLIRAEAPRIPEKIERATLER